MLENAASLRSSSFRIIESKYLFNLFYCVLTLLQSILFTVKYNTIMETMPLLLDPFSYFTKDYRVCVAISHANRFVHSVIKVFCINSIVMLICRSTVYSFFPASLDCVQPGFLNSFFFQVNSSHFILIISLDKVFFFTLELKLNS